VYLSTGSFGLWKNPARVLKTDGFCGILFAIKSEAISRKGTPFRKPRRRPELVINIQDDILKLQFMGLLDGLLVDKTTGKNIIWGTDTYRNCGAGYGCRDSIKPELITGMNAGIVKTHARRAMEQQSERTRQRAEVPSPLWVCRKMCDYADEVWTGKDWTDYVDSRRLEITCGEAPYLASRYNVETGEAIPIHDRIGLLDRKLRAVSENTQTEDEWMKWVFRAFWATYGYDYQGDNVLIARVNLLMTFEEYLWEQWKRRPTPAEYRKLTTVIVWNIWQMDGLTGATPGGIAEDEYQEIDWFGMFSGDARRSEESKQPRCRVYNWTGGGSVEFLALPTRGKRAMKFDFIIGNPPYQQESNGANANDTPIYHYFYDATFKIADKVELISPARFLFNAGGTPKEWNAKMLDDPHLKILLYESDAAKIFPNTAINGGVAIVYRDKDVDYGSIGTFTAYPELNEILKKVQRMTNQSLLDIITNRGLYKYSDIAYEEQPEEMTKTADRRIAPSAFERMPDLFTESKPEDGKEYIRIYGNVKTERVYRWFRSDYIDSVMNLHKYKVFISKADGAAGQIGKPIPARIIGRPIVMEPGVGCTETYITIGATDSKSEAEAIEKYVKSKFVRTMIGVLKVTQNYAKPTWKYVPLQDFTTTSDIDWTKSIPEIDQQLYTKYGLDESEIQFIETHIKEME